MENPVNNIPDPEQIIADIYRRMERIAEIKNERASLSCQDARLAAEERRLRLENEEAEWIAQGYRWRNKVVDLATYRQLHRFRWKLQPISHVA